MDPALRAERLVKVFSIPVKAGGLRASLRSFFRRRYREVRALDDVSFAVAPGEIVAFLGPNGAGKTTALKLLSGLLYPSAGRVEVLGHLPQRRHRDFLRGIALVMGQRQQLAWDLTPLDSYLLNKVIYAIGDTDYRRRLDELTVMLDLGPLLDKPVRKLSLGERMKCELAGSLLHGPRVLFLDEPTIGLDVNAQQAVRRFVADYNARTGATVLLTSHYMADVEALAKRVIVIAGGRILHDGDLAALIAERAPEKLLRLQFSAGVPAAALAGIPGLVAAPDGGGVAISAPRERAAAIAADMLARFPVADIAIEEMPLDRVIADLFRHRESGAA